jgi:hypothetical protein
VVTEEISKAPGIDITVESLTSDLPEEKKLPQAKYYPDMTPQLALRYENSDQIALRDVYRILCHVTEVSTSLSNYDRERISALWRDLLRVFFNMPVHFCYSSNASSSLHCIPHTDIAEPVSSTTGSEAVSDETVGSDKVDEVIMETNMSSSNNGPLSGAGVGGANPVLLDSDAIPTDPSSAWPNGLKVHIR